LPISRNFPSLQPEEASGFHLRHVSFQIEKHCHYWHPRDWCSEPLLGQSASANLVTNGTFNTDLSGWILVANDGFTGFRNNFGNSPNGRALANLYIYNNVAATGPSTTLSFVGYDNPSYFWVDNVKATPDPLPALGVAAAFGFSRRLRQRIKQANS
jgi:hypothetical protein